MRVLQLQTAPKKNPSAHQLVTALVGLVILVPSISTNVFGILSFMFVSIFGFTRVLSFLECEEDKHCKEPAICLDYSCTGKENYLFDKLYATRDGLRLVISVLTIYI